MLESWVKRPVELFAYPNGGIGDFSQREAGFLRKVGFVLGCTQVPGYASSTSDPFALPRFDIGQGHTPRVFKAYVSGFLPRLKGVN